MRCQQDQLYTSEIALLGMSRHVDNPQAWVNVQRDTWWWARWYWTVGYINVTVTRRPGYSAATYDHDDGCGYVTIHPMQSNERVLIHELAHVVAGKLHGSRSHDPWFAREYLNLVYLVMGSDAYVQLRASFVAHKIEFLVDANDLEIGGSNSSVV